MWLYWILIGLALIILETVLPSGFYLFIIGLAGILSGIILKFYDIGNNIYPVFFVVSILLGFTLKKHLNKLFHKEDRYSELSTLVIDKDIRVNEQVRMEYLGSSWNIKNIGTSDLTSGMTVKIVKTNGLVLEVKGE